MVKFYRYFQIIFPLMKMFILGHISLEIISSV